MTFLTLFCVGRIMLNNIGWRDQLRIRYSSAMSYKLATGCTVKLDLENMNTLLRVAFLFLLGKGALLAAAKTDEYTPGVQRTSINDRVQACAPSHKPLPSVCMCTKPQASVYFACSGG